MWCFGLGTNDSKKLGEFALAKTRRICYRTFREAEISEQYIQGKGRLAVNVPCIVGIHPYDGMKLLEAHVPFRSANGEFCLLAVPFRGRAELEEFLESTGLDAPCRL
jgi:hypothetical protein